MAARMGYKVKEYRTQIISVKQWLKEIDFDGLLIVEVYSSFFGSCQSIGPTINSVMLSVPEPETKIKWLVINVAKLEEEQKELLLNEEKIKAERALMLRRKMAADTENKEDGTTVNADAAGVLAALEEEEVKGRDQWDKVTIPKLEAYSGYDQPRPLWLLIKDGEILFELKSANPPKMNKLVQSVLTGVRLSEEELRAMDFHPEGKKRRGDKKGDEDKGGDDDDIPVKQEPKVILSLSLADYIRGESKSVKAQPLLAIYEWSPLTDNFKYIGRTERVPNETNPVFYKTFWLEKPKADKKYKVGLFEVEDDKSRELNVADMIGEVELNLRELLDEPKRRYRLVDGGGKELKTCLWVQAKDPAEPGQISRYALSVSARALPDSSSPVNVVLFLKDLNIPKFGPVSQTDALKPMSADTPYRPNTSAGASAGAPGTAGGAPGYIGRLIVDQYSLNDRQVRFGIYDSARFDPSLAWGLGDAEKALIGYAQTTMTKLLEMQQTTVDGAVQLPITDKDVQVGTASLILRAVEVPIPKEKRNAADDGKPKIEIAVSCRELHKKDWQSKSAPLVAIYRKNAEGKYDYLQQTERIRDDRSPSFWRTFLVDRPQAEAEYKVCVIDVDDDSVVVPNPPAPLPAPRGEILAEAVFDASALMDFATHDIRPADEEGLYLDKTMLSLTAKDVGQVKRVEVALTCRSLPPSGLSTKLLPDPMVVVYASNAVTRRWSRVPIAQSERLVAMKNPNFKHTVRLDVYSNADRELRVAVYDIEEGAESSFSESNCIGEAFISLNEFLNARAPLLEYKLMVRGADGSQAADGKAVVRLLTEKEPGGALREFEDEADMILEGDEDDDGDETSRSHAPKATPAIVVESKVELKEHPVTPPAAAVVLPVPVTGDEKRSDAVLPPPVEATAAAAAAPKAESRPQSASKKAGEEPKKAEEPKSAASSRPQSAKKEGAKVEAKVEAKKDESAKAAEAAKPSEPKKEEHVAAKAAAAPSAPATPVPPPSAAAHADDEAAKKKAADDAAKKKVDDDKKAADDKKVADEKKKTDEAKAAAEAPKKVEDPKSATSSRPQSASKKAAAVVDEPKKVEEPKPAAASRPQSATKKDETPRKDEPAKVEAKKDDSKTVTPAQSRPQSASKKHDDKKDDKKDDVKPVKVPIWLRVKDVTKQDWFSPSDPLVRAYVDGHLQGATEWSKNTATYEFKTPIEVTITPGHTNAVRFVVYDCDSGDKAPDDKDIVGEVNMTPVQLLSELSSSWPLLRGGKGKGQLIIIPLEAAVKSEATRIGRGQLHRRSLKIAASKLVSMDVVGKSDPIVLVYQKRLGNWFEVGRTEVIKDNHEPQFQTSVEIRYWQLQSATSEVRVAMYDADDDKGDKLKSDDSMGDAVVMIGDLLALSTPYLEAKMMKNGTQNKDCVFHLSLLPRDDAPTTAAPAPVSRQVSTAPKLAATSSTASATLAAAAAAPVATASASSSRPATATPAAAAATVTPAAATVAVTAEAPKA